MRVVARIDTGHIRIWCLYTCLDVQVQLKSCDIWLDVQEARGIKSKILYKKKKNKKTPGIMVLRTNLFALKKNLFLSSMRKMNIVGFLYFSLYTQLWKEGQTWGCSCCPFLHQLSCYWELQTAQCFCEWDFTLALRVSLKEFTVLLKGPLEILDTNKLLKKYLTGEKRFLVFA